MNDQIKDKVVVITGASSGIGEAIALLLAEKGAKIIIGARREEQLQNLTKKIIDKGGSAAFQVTDVRRRDDLKNLIGKAMEVFGRLDVLVNNAGISRLSRFDDLQVDDWDEMIDINLKGVLYGIAAALPIFRKQQSGHIINIISTSGLKIVPLQGVYAATKNAVRTISEALRQEAGKNLRITGISPGFVKTNLSDSIKDPNIRKAIAEKAEEIAIAPEAIAEAVAYAIGQPSNVDIGDIVIRPTAQD